MNILWTYWANTTVFNNRNQEQMMPYHWTRKALLNLDPKNPVVVYFEDWLADMGVKITPTKHSFVASCRKSELVLIFLQLGIKN